MTTQASGGTTKKKKEISYFIRNEKKNKVGTCHDLLTDFKVEARRQPLCCIFTALITGFRQKCLTALNILPCVEAYVWNVKATFQKVDINPNFCPNGV